jgi:hypothetical protein
MKILSTLKNGFQRLRKCVTRKHLMLAVPLVLILFLIPDVAFAAEGDTSADVIKKLVTVLNSFLQFLQLLLYPLLIIIAALMDNEMLIGPAMENKLRLIWVEIRNWVNIAFVLIMVGVAFYNVMGITGEGSNYALKSILPKIVIGLVAVNFSFLAGKVLIDSTAVVTNAVYALPQSANLVRWDDQRDELKTRLCALPIAGEDGVIDYSLEPKPRTTDAGSTMSFIFCETAEETFTGEFNSFGNNFFNHFGQHNVAVVMMVNLGNATDIQVPSEDGLNALSDITFATLFGILLFLMFGFAYAALAVVLIARVVVLWISLALSPIAVLLFVFPDLGQAAGGGLDIKEKFFGHLFVPLIIGVVFSIGFVMLSTLSTGGSGGYLGSLGQLKLDSIQITEQGTPEISAAYGKDLADFQKLLIAISAVVIIWMGVFAAAEKTVASSITGSIKSAGETAGKFVAKLPAYATAIPVKQPGGEKGEMMNLMTGIRTAMGMPGAMEQTQREKASAAIREWSGDKRGAKLDRLNKDIKDLTIPEAQKNFGDHLKDSGNWNNVAGLQKAAAGLALRVTGGGKKMSDDITNMSEGDFRNALKTNKGGMATTLLGDHGKDKARDQWEKAPPEAAPTTTPTTPAAAPAAPKSEAAKTSLNPSSGALSGPMSGAPGDAKKAVKDLLGDNSIDVTVNENVNMTGTTKAEVQEATTKFRALGDTQKDAIVENLSTSGGKIDGKSLVTAMGGGTEGGPAGEPSTP